jgi:transposase-like protein
LGVPAVSRPHLRDPKLEQYWRSTVAKWITSGLTIRDFCRKHRLSEPSFYSWRRELAARDGTPVARPVTTPKPTASTRRSSTRSRPPRPTPRRSSASAPRPSFVALRVVADAPLELVLRSGLVVRVPPGYDAGHLRTVVAALEAVPC